MEKKIVKGDVFIVPNYASKFTDFPEYSKEWLKKKLSVLAGIKTVRDEERMIQLWITSNDCDSWQDRFAGLQETIGICKKDFVKNCESSQENSRLLGYFPSYFPSRIFEGVKEGDTVTIDCPKYNVVIELTCKQLDYRYKTFGRFEEVFQSVLE